MEKERDIIVAKTAGFCFGVKRAVDTVYEQIESGATDIYTYGPIIHNEEVVNDLASKGVKVLNDINELKALDPFFLLRHIYASPHHVNV